MVHSIILQVLEEMQDAQLMGDQFAVNVFVRIYQNFVNGHSHTLNAQVHVLFQRNFASSVLYLPSQLAQKDC